jgi:DNA gyrase/topoisomerase IV subunit A
MIVAESDLLLLVTKDLKGKYTPVKDFSIDSRGNKGQTIGEETICVRRIEAARENIYLIPKQGKPFTLARNKLSIKSRTATGAALSTRNIIRII